MAGGFPHSQLETVALLVIYFGAQDPNGACCVNKEGSSILFEQFMPIPDQSVCNFGKARTQVSPALNLLMPQKEVPKPTVMGRPCSVLHLLS